MGEREVKLLVVRAGTHRVGLPIAHVRETMRPLPVEPLRDAMPSVLGLSIIRGASVPVVDLGDLLGRSPASGHFGRFVTLVIDGRAVALALDEVVGVVTLGERAFSALPPLLAHAARDVVQALSLADAQLLLVLEATKLVPDRELSAEASAS